MISVLKSNAIEADDYFFNAIIFLVESNAGGDIAFIINRPFPRPLNQLQEFAHLPLFPLFEGGPVGGEHLYFIHRRPDIIKEGKHIANDIFFGGNFNQATKAIAAGLLLPTDIRVFVGYCGWDAGELKAEINKGDWEERKANVFA